MRFNPPTTLLALSIGLLIAAGPALLHPSVVPMEYRVPVIMWATFAALALANALPGAERAVRAAVLVLSLTAIVGWFRAPPDHAKALSHFSNIGLGLLSCRVVSLWCDTEGRLTLATSLLCLAAIGALGMGLVGTEVYYPKFLPIRLPQTRNLYLEGLDSNTLVSPNALGAIAGSVGPIALCLAMLPARALVTAATYLVRVLGIATVALCVVVSLYTQSRSAWLAVFLTAGLFGLRERRRMGGWIVAATFLGALGSWAVSYLYFPAGYGAAVSLAQSRVAERLVLWRDGMATLMQAPWLGTGLNTFHQAHRLDSPDLQYVAHAHNTFLQVALDVGLVGLTAYIALVAVLLARAHAASRGPRRLAARVAAAAGASLVIIHLFGLGDAVALGAKLGQFQWLAAGLILAAAQIQRGGSLGGTTNPARSLDDTSAAPV